MSSATLSSRPDLDSEKDRRNRQALERELGAAVLGALGDPDLTEVMLNADGRLWTDSLIRGLEPLGERRTRLQAMSLISTVAGLLDRVVDRHHPVLEVELPLDGSRFEALVPPVVEAPIFAIRKRAGRVLPLEQYLAEGSLQPEQLEALQGAIERRQNILVAGGPGSGKTTFVNALLQEMVRLAPEGQRFGLLEDTYELRCEAPNHFSLHTSDSVSLRQLVRAALRLRPDRLIVGEVRGAEAHDLLKAWNTGNPGGCATVHANGAADALERLDLLAQEAGVPSQARWIASTVDWVAFLERHGNRRRVAELVRIRGWSPDTGFRVEPVTSATSLQGDLP